MKLEDSVRVGSMSIRFYSFANETVSLYEGFFHSVGKETRLSIGQTVLSSIWNEEV